VLILNSFHLIGAFFKDEIKSVWSCDEDKSPGPDGFNFPFFKACCGVLKDEIFGIV